MGIVREPVNIMFIVDGFRLGGAEKKLLELVKCLDSKLFNKVVVNIGTEGPLSDEFYSLDCPVYRIRRKKIPIHAFFDLVLLMYKHKIEVLQTVLVISDILGILAAKLSGVRFITSWETVTHAGDYYHNTIGYRFGYRLVMKYVNKIISVSDDVKQSIVECRNVSPDRIQTIHYGVDLNQYQALSVNQKKSLRKEHEFPSSTFIIGVVARLQPQKGHAYLVQAVAKVVQQYKNILILFIGDGKERENLESQVHGAHLNNKIQFLGFRDNVPELLNTLDLFCLPSVVGEGLPNVILEAMACGIPVVATKVGGTAEIISNGVNGFVIPPKDINTLEEKLSLCIGNSDLIEKLRTGARRTVEDSFSLQKQVAMFQKLFLNSHH